MLLHKQIKERTERQTREGVQTRDCFRGLKKWPYLGILTPAVINVTFKVCHLFSFSAQETPVSVFRSLTSESPFHITHTLVKLIVHLKPHGTSEKRPVELPRRHDLGPKKAAQTVSLSVMVSAL